MGKSSVVVLGAGPVGRAVGSRFLEKDFRVRFVTRSGAPVVPGADAVSADVRDAVALNAACEGASILVHAVGVPYPDWQTQFPPMQNAVLAAAEQTGAVVVFVENLYSYRADKMPLRESTQEIPPTKKGTLRLALSTQWQEAHRSGRVKAVSVRASDYFGPGATNTPNSHFGTRFFPAFERGKPVAFLGNPDALHSYTYLPDFARAIVDVAVDNSSWGQSWLAPSLEPTTARTVAGLFAAEAGRSAKVGKLPSGVVKLLGLFDPMIREVVEMLYQFERDFTVDSSAFEAKFGWKATPLAQAVKETWAAHLKAAR